jgi:hypothetical protein
MMVVVMTIMIMIMVMTMTAIGGLITKRTEGCCRVTALRLGIGRRGFKFRSVYKLLRVRFVVAFLSSSRQIWGLNLRFGHCRFFPYPFQLVIQ